MIDDGWAIAPKNLIQASAILNATNLGPEVQSWIRFSKLLIDFKQGRLGNLVADNCARTKTSDLSAEFRPDGAGRTGNHHHLIPEFLSKCTLIEPHGSAAEQIFQGNIANFRSYRMTLDDLCKARNCPATQTCVMAAPQDESHTGGRC